MKKMRSFLAAALMLVMAFSLMAVPAFAAEAVPDESGDVIVETPVHGIGGVMPLLSWTHTIGPNWAKVTNDGWAPGSVRIDIIDFNSALHQVDVMYQDGRGAPIGDPVYNVTELGNSAYLSAGNNNSKYNIPSNARSVYVRIVPRASWFVQNHWYHANITS